MKGQALITLLFFSVIAITVTSTAVVVLVVNSQSGAKFQQGTIAYQIAKSGIEEAKLRFLRDPSYTGTVEPLIIDSGSVTIERSGSGPYTFISTGRIGNFVKKIQVVATYSANLLTVGEQEEVF